MAFRLWSKKNSEQAAVAQRTFAVRSTVEKATASGELPESKQVKDVFAELYGSGVAIEPPYNPVQMFQLMQLNEIHSSCVGAKAADATGRGFEFLPSPDVQEPDETQVRGLDRRLNRMNPEMPFVDLLGQAVTEMDAVGWAAWEIGRVDGLIAAIYPIPAHTIRATAEREVWIQIRNGTQAYFKTFGADVDVHRQSGRIYEAGKLAEVEKANEVIVFRRYSPLSDWYGVPPWVSNLASLAENRAIGTYNIEWFESAGVMSKLVAIKSTASATAVVDEITNAIREGRGKNHRSVVFELPEDGTMQVEDMAAKVSDAKFMSQRKDLNRLVMIAHQVPPYRIGMAELGALGGSAAREMLRVYNTGVVEPIQRAIEHRLESTLFGPNGIMLSDWDFHLLNLESAEEELDLSVATAGVEKAILTPNEARERMGYEKSDDPEMDRFYWAGQPIDTDGEAASVLDAVAEIKTALQVALAVEDAPEAEVVVEAPAAEKHEH